MNFKMVLYQLLSIILISGTFVYSAVLSATAATAHEAKRIDYIDDYLLLWIGKYLACPQKELGSLNKNWYNLFMKQHPYSRFLIERHAIKEFEHSTSDKDLAVFSQLAFIKDEAHLYKSIYTQLFKFSYNQHLMFRYLARIRNELDANESVDSIPEWYEHDARNLQKDTDYNYMIEYVIMEGYYSFRKFCTNLDMTIGKAFMQHVLSIDDALYRRIEKHLGLKENMREFDQVKAAKNVYKRLLSDIVPSPLYHGSFLLISVLAGVPDAWYFPYILNLNSEKRFIVLMKVLYFTQFIGSSEDNERIHSTMNRLFNGIKGTDIRLLKLLNDMRFGTVDNEIVITKMASMNLGFKSFYNVIAVASVAKNYDLLREIKRHFPDDNWPNIHGGINNVEHGIHVFFGLLEIYSEEEKKKLLADLNEFYWIMEFYDVGDFEYNPDTLIASCEFIRKTGFSDKGLPSTFELNFEIVPEDYSMNSVIRGIVNFFFLQSTERSEESMARLLEGYKQIRKLELDHPLTAEKDVSCAFLKSIARSEMLVDMVKAMGLYFIVNSKDLANFLEDDVSSLRDVMNLELFNVREALSQVINFRQIRNLEKLLGIDIAEMIMKHVITGPASEPEFFLEISSASSDDSGSEVHSVSSSDPTSDSSSGSSSGSDSDLDSDSDSSSNTETSYEFTNAFCQKYYFKLSTALRYWLKSPQRHRMFELKAKHSLLLKLLLKEVDMEDAEFLKSL